MKKLGTSTRDMMWIAGGAIVALLLYISGPQLVAELMTGGPPEDQITRNEARTIVILRTVAAVSEEYRARHETYPGATSGDGLADIADPASGLTGALRPAICQGVECGYLFTYHGTTDTWSCTADPCGPTTGRRSYFIDQTAVIRSVREFTVNGSATAESAPLPGTG